MDEAAQGQKARQQERVEEYRQWSGATPVDEDGQVKEASGEVNLTFVTQEVKTIKATLKSGVSKIRLDISHAPTVEAIRAELTAEESARVQSGDEGDAFPV